MSTAADGPAGPAGGLRLRHAPRDVSDARSSDDNDTDDDPFFNTTYGRTPDDIGFVVPKTHDMVSQLLDPREPKNRTDVIVLGVLALHILLAYLLPSESKRLVFALVFVFWRACYNVGIGFLLHIQSRNRQLVVWAKKWKLFVYPEEGRNPRPWLYKLLKRELEAKITENYDFQSAPIEYNTWLVFRRVVDLILMCDFVSYCLFAIICAHTPKGESIVIGISRWALGLLLTGFNLWVKLDAHRVVKDYAWYWGDFFFLIDEDLTFDGVFEMAPHPMYSIGYAGYYGISMMAASYEVLFISILAHLAQFAFLVAVENPHIEKTYNPPPPREKLAASSRVDISAAPGSESSDMQNRLHASFNSGLSHSRHHSSAPVHGQFGLGNLDLFRVPDCAVVILPAYLATLTAVTPSSPLWQTVFVLHALFWRIWYHAGLGVLLHRQSKSKMWTRHFLKFGESADEAWRQWKGIYHISVIMCNVSAIAACWKMYNLPEDWENGLVLLKHVVGAGLIALQLWTALSVYESLGEFGWFCGDFFFDHEAKLTYTSIYRFLNNPERVFGTTGIWGGALITWSGPIFIMALVTSMLNAAVIAFVERPHMQKIYGRSMRQEAGLTKFIRRTLPPPLQGWQESVDKVLDDTTHFVVDFIEHARPMFASGVQTVMRDTTRLFNTAPTRLTITRITTELAGLDPKCYSLTVEGSPSMQSVYSERAMGKESLTGRSAKDVKTMSFEYGAPLRVRWRAPARHGKTDWIGLYMVTDNRSREKTEVSSLGRWVPTNVCEWDSSIDSSSIVVHEHSVDKTSPSDPDMVEGEVVFQGDKLWWTQGVFEFRYHHDGRHNVMTVSEPFEIVVGKFSDEDLIFDAKTSYVAVVEHAMLPVVQNCLDRDPNIAPSSVGESFGSHVWRDGKYARRIVYALREMFGIELAPAVVLADRNVQKLAWRICNAKVVLAPYSMSRSKGSTTPAEEGEGVDDKERMGP